LPTTDEQYVILSREDGEGSHVAMPFVLSRSFAPLRITHAHD